MKKRSLATDAPQELPRRTTKVFFDRRAETDRRQSEAVSPTLADSRRCHTERRSGRSLADDYYAFVAREAQSRDVTGDPTEILETPIAEQ